METPMTEAIGYTTDESIDDDIAGALPLLLDFGADWCEPCKALEPVVAQVAVEFAGRVRVLQVDLDESPDVASRFSVMSIPTMLFIKDGNVVKRLRGTYTSHTLGQELESLLAQA
jgi:thioredoxin 1